ncbi:MAG: glycosyltransferase family 2 protein [Candidatus Paceibacterota bacterium]
MRVSVLVIAHNEEKHIRKCLVSLQNQTRTPDEIIVIAHNCTDDTVRIVNEFSRIRVVVYDTKEEGPIYARIAGFKEVAGDIIACIDGDSHASQQWLEKITKPFKDSSIVGVGGVIWFNGFIANLATIGFFFLDPLFRPTYHFYFWGANFAVRKSVYDAVGGLEPLIMLKEKLGLHLMPDDAYLSLALMKQGRVLYTCGAPVYSDDNFFNAESFIKNKGDKQNDDRLALFRHFGLIK